MNNWRKIWLFLGILSFITLTSYGKTIEFSGLTWEIRRDGRGSPSQNYWRESNVWTDKTGALHLKIRRVGGVWTCAELRTKEKFLYGEFSFEVIGELDKLDKNIVFGLFKYPDDGINEGQGEIDIEFAKWGDENNPSGNFTLWKNEKEILEKKVFPVNLQGTYSEHLFLKTPQSVSFQSFHGHNRQNEIFSWKYFGKNLSRVPMPIYLNFWLFRGQPPSNLQEAEIIVKSVKIEKSS